MSETSENSQAGQRVSLVVVAVAAVLVLGALSVSPPAHGWLTGGDVIDTGAMRVLAWALSGAMAALGLALWAGRRRISGVELCLLAGTMIVCGVLGEVALFAAGVMPIKHLILRVPALEEAWEREGPMGPRFVAERYQGDWPVNAAGYTDRDEFSAEAAAVHSRRVLLLGDSFAQGASASSFERSFAAILDQELGEETAVWGMGLGGTGQRQDLAALKTFFPALEPQLVVLTFCLNDFRDNEYPLGGFYCFSNYEWIRAYLLREDGPPLLLSPEAAYRRAYVAAESVRDLPYTSRIVTSAISVADRLQRSEDGGALLDNMKSGTAHVNWPLTAAGRVVTQRLLGEIQHYVESHGAQFRVLIIPKRERLESPGESYLTMLEIAAELGLEVWEVWPLLETADYAPEPDPHWNDSGHRKVGSFLKDRIAEVYAEL